MCTCFFIRDTYDDTYEKKINLYFDMPLNYRVSSIYELYDIDSIRRYLFIDIVNTFIAMAIAMREINHDWNENDEIEIHQIHRRCRCFAAVSIPHCKRGIGGEPCRTINA